VTDFWNESCRIYNSIIIIIIIIVMITEVNISMPGALSNSKQYQMVCKYSMNMQRHAATNNMPYKMRLTSI
jgi:hypothetical protein